MIKKHINIALASSLLFTTLGTTTVANHASAKEHTVAKTAAVKSTAYKNFYFGDSIKTFKKKAKNKKWVFIEDHYRGGYYGMYYIGKVYGHKATILIEFKSNSLVGMGITFNNNSNLTTWKKVEAYQKELYRKLNKDLNYKKSSTLKIDNTIKTQWKFNKKEVHLSVGYNHANILFSN